MRQWTLTFTMTSVRPRTTTVTGRWMVRWGSRHLEERLHAELEPGASTEIRDIVNGHASTPPRFELLGRH